ncbi:MAG: hypothetical protein A2190_12280 [Lysobacterales bacterium RIFOXYA1_FULL_69_10]|nr:MAG: hypothetical protein A2190_12280 [Xanthomonadales bacterium RIFOXYA1_FULL_69_10]
MASPDRNTRNTGSPRSLFWLVVMALAVVAAIWALRSTNDDATPPGPEPDQVVTRSTPETAPVVTDKDALATRAPPVDGRPANAPAEAIPASAIPPEFPLEAVRRGESGRVLLKVAVGVDGAPGAIAVARSSGSELLDRAALEAVSRWRFRPARRDGDDVASTLEIPIDFRPPG